MKDYQAEQEIQDTFRKMDEIFEPIPPNESTLLMILEIKKKKHKQLLKRELMNFILISSVILIILTTILFKAPTIYIIIQVIGIVSVPLYSLFDKEERNRKDYFV